MRNVGAAILILGFLYVGVLLCQNDTGLVSKALREAEAFKESASVPSVHGYENDFLHSDIDQALKGLRTLAAGDVDRWRRYEGMRSIEGAADSVGLFMKLPGARGTDQWSVLCFDLAKLIEQAGDKARFYCPAAEAVFARMYPPQPKHPWPDLTEPVRSYADDKKSLPPNPPSFAVPGILGQVYAGNLSNVADDENTRNYLGSILREQMAKCPKLDTVEANKAVINYWAHIEWKNQQKMMHSAVSNDIGGFLQSFVSGPQLASAHRSLIGMYDADLMIKHYGCDGHETRQLASNILRVAQDRGDLMPDVPNNEFFRAQFSKFGRDAGVELKYTDRDSALMRSLRKSCEDMYDAVSGNQENYCRCQTQMLLRSGVPQSELGGLQSKFSSEELNSLAARYPSFAQWSKACYN
ncbi:MAG: hypothetical protein WCC22_03320 [Terriglobales bacterium]